jgi:hypothetical protein
MASEAADALADSKTVGITKSSVIPLIALGKRAKNQSKESQALTMKQKHCTTVRKNHAIKNYILVRSHPCLSVLIRG